MEGHHYLTLLQQSLSLSTRSEILTQQIGYENYKPEFKKSLAPLRNSHVPPHQGRISVAGKILYQVTENPRIKISVIYQQYQSSLVSNQCLGTTFHTFIKTLESKVKQIMLSVQVSKMANLDQRSFTKMSNFITNHLTLEMNFKYLTHAEKHVMKYDLIKYILNEKQNHRNFQEMINLRELLANTQFGITCIKNENDVFCVSIIYFEKINVLPSLKKLKKKRGIGRIQSGSLQLSKAWSISSVRVISIPQIVRALSQKEEVPSEITFLENTAKKYYENSIGKIKDLEQARNEEEEEKVPINDEERSFSNKTDSSLSARSSPIMAGRPISEPLEIQIGQEVLQSSSLTTPQSNIQDSVIPNQSNEISQNNLSEISEIKITQRHGSMAIPRLNFNQECIREIQSQIPEHKLNSQSMHVPGRIQSLIHLARFQEMLEEYRQDDQKKENEVRDALKSKVKEMQDRLQANKLFMNMVIHDLRSPSENIQHGLSQAKEVMEVKVSKIIQKTQEMILNKMIKIESINSCYGSIRKNGLNNISEQNSILAQNKLIRGSDSYQLSSFRKNHVNRSFSQKDRADSFRLPQSDEHQRSFNIEMIPQNNQEIKNSIFTIQEDGKDEFNPSSKMLDLVAQNYGNNSNQLKKQIDHFAAQIDNEEEKEEFMNQRRSKSSSPKFSHVIEPEEEQEFIPLINNAREDSFIASEEQDSIFDFNSSQMEESSFANLPKLTECNDNVGVMKNEPKGQIEFIEKIVYVDRDPFIGIERGVQTDALPQEESKNSKMWEDDKFYECLLKYTNGLTPEKIKNFLQDIQNYQEIIEILKIESGTKIPEETIKIIKTLYLGSSIPMESFSSVEPNSKSPARVSLGENGSDKIIRKSWSQQNVKNQQKFKQFRAFTGKIENKQRFSNHDRLPSRISQQIAKKLGQKSDEVDPSPMNTCCGRCIKVANFFLCMFEEFEDANQKMDQYVQQSIASAFTLTNIVNDLLDLAKMEKATFNLAIEQFNMFETIAEAYQILLFQAEQKGVKLMVEFNKNQPFIFRKVYGDKRRFLQVLLNCVSNSLKFTNSGGFVRIQLIVLQEQQMKSEESTLKTPKRLQSQNFLVRQEDLATSSYDQNKFIKLKMVIQDSGVGIKKENLDKIFQDYSRLDEHQKMNQKGTGLGMSICKRIVEQMGGKCSIDSEVGVGTQISIVLNMKAVDKIMLVHDQTSVDNLLQSLDAHKYSPDFLQKFEQEKQFEPNNSIIYTPEAFPVRLENEVQLESKIMLYSFNPLGINQSRGKNQKIIEKLKQQLISYSDYQKIQLNQSVISSISEYIPANQHLFIRNQQFQKQQLQIDDKSSKNSSMDNSIIIEKVYQIQQNASDKQKSVKLEDDIFVFEEEKQSSARGQNSPCFVQEKMGFKIESDENYRRNIGFAYPHQLASPQKDVKLPIINKVQQYKEKKLKLLVANDNSFQLLIVSNSLGKIEQVGSIDQATNGQEAVDLVKRNETNSKCRYYDLIFLDLDMPILNGYEACGQIVKFYEKQRSENILSELNIFGKDEEKKEENDPDWMADLQVVYNQYLSQKNEEDAQKTLKIFKLLYKRVRYRALSNHKEPFIFAYSSLVTDEIVKQTKEAGFISCLTSPLTVADAKNVISENLDKFVEKYIDNKFIQTFPKLNKFSQFLVDYENIESIKMNQGLRIRQSSLPLSSQSNEEEQEKSNYTIVDSKEIDIIYEDNAEEDPSVVSRNTFQEGNNIEKYARDISMSSENSINLFSDKQNNTLKPEQIQLSYRQNSLANSHQNKKELLKEEKKVPISSISRKSLQKSFPSSQCVDDKNLLQELTPKYIL